MASGPVSATIYFSIGLDVVARAAMDQVTIPRGGTGRLESVAKNTPSAKIHRTPAVGVSIETLETGVTPAKNRASTRNQNVRTARKVWLPFS